MAATKQLLINSTFQKISISNSSPKPRFVNGEFLSLSKSNSLSTKLRTGTKPQRAVPGKDGIVPVQEDNDGVSLGTLKLPGNTDLARFEILLFQWANSLCQGSNLPLPLPLKVDKVQGGARIGFIEVDEGKTKVLVYIDCIVSSGENGSGPMFRAVRNGLLKADVAPGEERIMRSLLLALQKSVEIARL